MFFVINNPPHVSISSNSATGRPVGLAIGLAVFTFLIGLGIVFMVVILSSQFGATSFSPSSAAAEALSSSLLYLIFLSPSSCVRPNVFLITVCSQRKLIYSSFLQPFLSFCPYTKSGINIVLYIRIVYLVISKCLHF